MLTRDVLYRIGFGFRLSMLYGVFLFSSFLTLEAAQRKTISVGLKVPEIISMDYLNLEQDEISLKVTTACTNGKPVCVVGTSYVDFLVFGNVDAVIAVEPTAGFAMQHGSRQIGVFENSGVTADGAPELLYDMTLEVIDASLGKEGFRYIVGDSAAIYQLDDLPDQQEHWIVTADLTASAKRARLYIHPVFQNSAVDGLPYLPAVGTYNANISISMTSQ